MGRLRNGRTAEKGGARFLATLAEVGNVRLACQAAGIGRSTAYEMWAGDKAFADAWDAALDEAADMLEAEARRRAIEGVEERVLYRGVEVSRVRKYSDLLLIFLLKAARPERFDDSVRLRRYAGGDDVSPEERARELAQLTRQFLRELDSTMHGGSPGERNNTGG